MANVLNEYRDRYRQFLESEGEAAAQSRERQQSWSGKGAAEDYAQAMYNTIRRPYEESAMDLRGTQVGQGRVRTGFGFEDMDRHHYYGMVQPMADAIGRGSIQLAGMDLSNITSMAGSQDRYGDILASAYDLELARANADKQEKKRRGGILGGILGGVAGALIPGVGPIIGSAAGGAIGSLF
jgi:hypothetical protein